MASVLPMEPMPKYPGWNLDLRWNEELVYPMGIHYNSSGAHSALLFVREVAMMLVMDRLTDKPDWHLKVFDDDIADKWRQEALAWPNDDLWKRISNISSGLPKRWQPKKPRNILSKECIDYCILELRHKAEHFGRTGITPTLDATFNMAKSDVLVPRELHLALREAFARLRADQASCPDWHPNTNEKVLDLVHPSMYPLVYGRSRFLPQEVVGVDDAVDKWAGKGDVIPRKPEWGDEPTNRTSRSVWPDDTCVGGEGIHKSYWSTIYQWLPANVKFTANGGVHFTSYINNLHPAKYRDIYSTIEKLIEKALPMWDHCLAENEASDPGRHEPRMSPNTMNPDDENADNWDPKSEEEMLAREAVAKGTPQTADQPRMPGREDGESSGKIHGKSDSEDSEPDGKEDGESDRENSDDVKSDDGDETGEDEDENNIYDRWTRTREPVLPQPPPFATSKVSYAVDPAMTLRETFKDTGLQIIVKMASIKLTPEKPKFPAGGWHVEGQMNEHIIGTALYYLDSENVTDSRLDFRTLTSYYQEDLQDQIGQCAYHWMQSACGTNLGSGSGSPCMQNYGSVMTPEGRLLAFPNVFQHRVSGFRLADPTKPGHRRFIALWLVDPHTRIISTANVPPQQAEWWAERALGSLDSNKNGSDSSMLPPEIAQLLLEKGLGKSQLAEAIAAGDVGKTKLPAELLDMVRKELGEGLPMTREEAEEHRLKLMGARSAFQVEARDRWESVEYSFCEH